MLKIRLHNGLQPCKLTGKETPDKIQVELLNGFAMWILRKDYKSRPNWFVQGDNSK